MINSATNNKNYYIECKYIKWLLVKSVKWNDFLNILRTITYIKSVSSAETSNKLY